MIHRLWKDEKVHLFKDAFIFDVISTMALNLIFISL